MIIAIAACLIGSLLILANYKALRRFPVLIIAAILTAGMFIAGIWLVIKSTEVNILYAAFLSPGLALFLFLITRAYYQNRYHQEIILHMHGFYPIRHEERYVSRFEKRITFLITLLSVAIPIIILECLI